jgi:hypothetical protein
MTRRRFRRRGTQTLVSTTPPEQAALAKLTANWRALVEQRLGQYDMKGQKRMAFEKGGL